MNLSSLTTRAKEMFTRRGGADAAKQDAQELKDIAQGPGSMTDKAKEAAEAIKDPGAPGGDTPRGGHEAPGAPGGDTPRHGHDAPGAGEHR